MTLMSFFFRCCNFSLLDNVKRGNTIIIIIACHEINGPPGPSVSAKIGPPYLQTVPLARAMEHAQYMHKARPEGERDAYER